MSDDKVNILLVDDQPSKLLSHQAILSDLNENLLTAGSARDALGVLLKHDIAVVLIDVYMPETDGFELAAMIREHPRFRELAIIFISAVLQTDVDRLHGYEMGAVDYVPVPVIPEMLRAKVKVFVELYRKTRQLERLNRELEARVAERTAELAASASRLLESERQRSVALEAGQMGTWDWDLTTGKCVWDAGQFRIFGVDSKQFELTFENIRRYIHPEDLERIQDALSQVRTDKRSFQTEVRIKRPDGTIRWCVCAAAMTTDASGRVVRVMGVSIDITDRKQAEERLMLLAEEVDHRARNVITVVQSIIRITRAENIEEYVAALNGRIRALSIAHKLLAKSRWEGADLNRLVEEEIEPYRAEDVERIDVIGPAVLLPPATAQSIALALHELVTNAAKYGALSVDSGRVKVMWEMQSGCLKLSWVESDGPEITCPSRHGYGMRVVTGGIEGQLGGVVKFEWMPEGMRCSMSVPYDKDGAVVWRPDSASLNDAVAASEVSIVRRGNAVLLVEDEPLISMMLEELLIAFGHGVDGPYNKMSDAMIAAANRDLHAGILDINVGGEKIYALAEVLAKRKIPFVFVTGYSPGAVDARFSHVPVLQKPIEPQKLRSILLNAARQ